MYSFTLIMKIEAFETKTITLERWRWFFAEATIITVSDYFIIWTKNCYNHFALL